MSHSRNANRSWDASGHAPRDGSSTRRRSPDGLARGDGLHADGAAYRAACRLFPGFAELPAAFRASLDAYAPLLTAESGPLTLRDREAIAHAIRGSEGDGFGAEDDRATHEEERARLVAAFAVKVTRRWLAIEGRDVERLLDAGVPASGIRAIAETAAVFHFLAEVSAAMLLRPRLTSGGRAPIAGVASRDPSWRELGRWLT